MHRANHVLFVIRHTPIDLPFADKTADVPLRGLVTGKPESYLGAYDLWLARNGVY